MPSYLKDASRRRPVCTTSMKLMNEIYYHPSQYGLRPADHESLHTIAAKLAWKIAKQNDWAVSYAAEKYLANGKVELKYYEEIYYKKFIDEGHDDSEILSHSPMNDAGEFKVRFIRTAIGTRNGSIMQSLGYVFTPPRTRRKKTDYPINIQQIRYYDIGITPMAWRSFLRRNLISCRQIE